MKELATLKVEELPDGTIVLTWDENDPSCAFLNGKTDKEIIAIIESGLDKLVQEEKQARLKALDEMVKNDQEMGFY